MTLSILRQAIEFLLGPSLARAYLSTRVKEKEVCTDTRTHTHDYEKLALLVVRCVAAG